MYKKTANGLLVPCDLDLPERHHIGIIETEAKVRINEKVLDVVVFEIDPITVSEETRISILNALGEFRQVMVEKKDLINEERRIAACNELLKDNGINLYNHG